MEPKFRNAQVAWLINYGEIRMCHIIKVDNGIAGVVHGSAKALLLNGTENTYPLRDLFPTIEEAAKEYQMREDNGW